MALGALTVFPSGRRGTERMQIGFNERRGRSLRPEDGRDFAGFPARKSRYFDKATCLFLHNLPLGNCEFRQSAKDYLSECIWSRRIPPPSRSILRCVTEERSL